MAAFDEIQWSMLAVVGMGRDPEGPAPSDTTKSQFSHQAFDRAAGHPDAFAVELSPDLVGPVDREVLGVDPGDGDLEVSISNRPG